MKNTAPRVGAAGVQGAAGKPPQRAQGRSPEHGKGKGRQ